MASQGTPALALRAALVIVAALLIVGCDDEERPSHLRVVDADPNRGREIIRSFGCPACHIVPGIREARGTVGPPLTAFSKRAYIAGSHPNRPDTLVRWVMNAPLMSPDTAMPNMGVTAEEARHIAAFLYTLR